MLNNIQISVNIGTMLTVKQKLILQRQIGLTVDNLNDNNNAVKEIKT